MGMMLGLGLSGTASAGSVYINGVRADGLSNMEMTNVNVRVDANGDIWIDAPRYTVEVVSPGGTTAGYGASPPVTSPPPSAVVPPVAGNPPTPAAPTAQQPTAVGVAPGTWWLVTDDNASKGHVVDIYIGGVLVHTVRSGEQQVLMDVSPYLRHGGNLVQFTARAGNQPSGGALHIYIGSGSNQSGTLNLHSPEVTFTRRSSDSPNGTSRQFQLNVP